MRDPARINQILGLVRQVWSSQPDMRLIQLLINTAYLAGSTREGLYYFSDDELCKALTKEVEYLDGKSRPLLPYTPPVTKPIEAQGPSP